MDLVYRTFLTNTLVDALDIDSRSDVLRLVPNPQTPPTAYLCMFDVPYLRRLPAGTVAACAGPVVCFIGFPQDYLYSADPHLYLRVASVLTPDFVHPNVAPHGAVCLGAAFRGGTTMSALIWELYEIVSYRNCTVDERNAFSPEACRLIRANGSLLRKLGAGPLFRKKRRLQVTVRPMGEGPHAS